MTKFTTSRRQTIFGAAALGLILTFSPSVALAQSEPEPFEVSISDEALERIQRQVADARIATEMPGAPSSSGMTSEWLADLQAYWADSYDWRAAEARFNQYDQFTVTIDGQRLHYFHVKGKGPNPTPVLLAHGWPYSNFTFVSQIERLTDPEQFGGSADDALTLVIPAQPGYGFSAKPSAVVGPQETAALYRKLMVDVLGYARYGLQGGDHGAVVTPIMANTYPDDIIGLHLNLVPVVPVAEADQTSEEREWNALGGPFFAAEMDYFRAQMNKPRMVASTLAASPIATAAWISEKYWAWSDHNGDLDTAISKDQLLDEIMIYVLTESVESSVWYYNTFSRTPFFPGDTRIDVPTAVFVPQKEFIIGNPPRVTIERSYDLVRLTRPENGQHFPFIETPDAFANDLLAFFASLR